MENYFKNLKISDFSLFKHFTNHRLPLNNYQTGKIHISLSRDIIQSEEIILDSFFENTIQKIEYHILEVLFSKFKSSLREDFVDTRFDKELSFHFERFNLKNVILSHSHFLKFTDFLLNLNLPITNNYQAPTSSIFSDLGKFHGVGIYYIKPNLDKNIQVGDSEFYSFDEIYFDICDFNYYISEDYVSDLVNLQVGFKYYLSLINPCKFHLIENEKSPNYIKFTRELRDNKISKILYD